MIQPVTLPFSKMPVSFTGKAFMWAAQTDIFNPINKGQKGLNLYLGKPVRLILRLIYNLAITIIAPFGILYHTAFGVGYSALIKLHNYAEIQKTKGNTRALQTESLTKNEVAEIKSLATAHFKAAGMDFFSLISGGGIMNWILSNGLEEPFFINPNESDVQNMFFLPTENVHVGGENAIKRRLEEEIIEEIAFNKYFCIKLNARENQAQKDQGDWTSVLLKTIKITAGLKTFTVKFEHYLISNIPHTKQAD